MAFCSDKGVNYLTALGYNVVRIPRTNVAPRDLIGRDRDQMRLGTLDQLVTNPGALPPLTTDADAANISGKSTNKMKVGIGLNILGPIVNALAGTTLGIKAAYEKAKSVQFSFEDVTMDSVEPAAVGQFLRSAEIDVENPVLKRYVLGKGQLFVIMEALKSKKLTVTSEASSSGGVAVDVPVIQAAASGKLEVDVSKAASGQVTYTGTKPLVFGFKCMRVALIEGALDVRDVTPGDISLALGSVPAAEGTELFELDEGPLGE
jgi:hypothetical protein